MTMMMMMLTLANGHIRDDDDWGGDVGSSVLSLLGSLSGSNLSLLLDLLNFQYHFLI